MLQYAQYGHRKEYAHAQRNHQDQLHLGRADHEFFAEFLGMDGAAAARKVAQHKDIVLGLGGYFLIKAYVGMSAAQADHFARRFGRDAPLTSIFRTL